MNTKQPTKPKRERPAKEPISWRAVWGLLGQSDEGQFSLRHEEYLRRQEPEKSLRHDNVERASK